MRIFGISGSLRAESTNRRLLELYRSVVQDAGGSFETYGEIAEIPPFNPDLEAIGNEGPVLRFRESIAGADAVVISTPEYAHGIPGALKNAIDWLVGSGELVGKPVVLVQAKAHSVYVLAALKEVLAAVDARVIAEAQVVVDPKAASADLLRIVEESYRRVVLALDRLS